MSSNKNGITVTLRHRDANEGSEAFSLELEFLANRGEALFMLLPMG